MHQAIQRILRFDRFALDLTRGCLRCGEEEVALRPKAFEMLRYLAENAGRLVSKQEIYAAVWPNVTVSDDSIAQCVRELRDKLGDNDHSLIKTVSRRGYLLDAVVTADMPDQIAVTRSTPRLQVGIFQRIVTAVAHILAPWRPVFRKESRLHVRLAVTGGAAVLLGVLAIHLLGRVDQASGVGHPSVAAPGGAGVVPRPGFKDCADCPEMVPLTSGEFMMGSPAGELGHLEVEGAPRRVTIPKPFAIGKFEVTVDQFSAFVADTGMTAGNSCRQIAAFDRTPAVWGPPEGSFRKPGFDVTGSQPVVCVSWHEAQAYVAWLRRRTGKPYRLPTEAEWEYAARAGTDTTYSFGGDGTQLCAYARFADLSSRYIWHDGCRSDTTTYGPLPVGSLKPNPWGLFDMHGNAWEWVEDCWTPTAAEIPTDGSAFVRPGNCEMGVVRGGSFAAGSRRVRSAIRAPVPTANHNFNDGFRVALSLGN
jgi:formylglycine-generating enzyme required for sulfatase activity/DNA-binding winged helix-turn-helix (wHTH) protein